MYARATRLGRREAFRRARLLCGLRLSRTSTVYANLTHSHCGIRVSLALTGIVHLPPSPGTRPVLEAGRRSKVRGPTTARVKEYQQKQLLERVNREGATVGADIPDRVTVQGEEIDLRDFVFEIKRRDTIPTGERERVERAKKNLRRERLQRLQRIERNEVGYEEGQELVESIVGIDRALNALEQLRPADLEREAEVQKAADQKRWMKFLRQALGREDANKPSRR